MKKIYWIPAIIFGFGFVIVLSIFVIFVNMNQLVIDFDNTQISIIEEGHNIEKEINIEDIEEIKYIETNEILYSSEELFGPSTRGRKIARQRNLQNVSVNKYGIDTKDFAAGKGYSELVGDCEVYIYWDQKSYIILKTTEKYVVLNKENDEETQNLYLELKKNLEKVASTLMCESYIPSRFN